MNLTELYKLQNKLDQYMMNKHNLSLTEDIKKKRYIALKVEIGEFVNDIQDFKYWKTNNKPKKTALEEGTDVLHFMLSVAIMNGWDMYLYSIKPHLNIEPMTDLTIRLEQNRFEDFRDYENGIVLLYQILGRLGYTESDITTAYHEKNLINYQRQQEGY